MMHLQYYSVGRVYAICNWVINTLRCVLHMMNSTTYPDNGTFCPWIQKRLCMNLNQYLAEKSSSMKLNCQCRAHWWQQHQLYEAQEQDIFKNKNFFLVSNFLRQFFSHGLNHTILIIVNNKLVYFRVRIICLDT